ncbi:hypothetical protein HC024_03210 [Methylococcaceae bacterium WWC4]|nr:hypothetical protein [Methylococcaceae bacterium WWC4]
MNLQKLIEEALNKKSSIGDRFYTDDEEESEHSGFRKFINTHRSRLGMEFGNLVLYADGINKQTLTIDLSAEEVDVEQIAPPQTIDGRRREFLESILYYGIKDNHVVLLQSMALKSREFEDYLNWFLRSAGVISEETKVFLNNFTPTITKEKLDQATVKSVKIGTPLYNTFEEIISDRVTSTKKRFKPVGEGLDILKLVAPNRLDDIFLDEIRNDSNLEVFVEVSYKRTTDNDSQELLNKLTKALREVGDDDIKIELKGAGTIVGSELQIKSFKNIVAINGVVEPKSVFENMHDWLADNLEMGFIDPD